MTCLASSPSEITHISLYVKAWNGGLVCALVISFANGGVSSAGFFSSKSTMGIPLIKEECQAAYYYCFQ